ncbi:hypothetical protein [Nesterenkonia alkaliphila]|uniref:Uncharacterized protein n=1 Tax=Nesterenkonia alkaliphila TaxID=1463631 RepID=A0A7K1UKS2_9MICC|nr:hypothetical protein [Nesterenkonia alkaliphila]MVT26922.1 hypothetical protein [Nesterenkonia alkaliphila]GFZ90678.1 hypothetical protein GCM10011359_20060 [Nesterenkonia alkaliphila]
MRWSRRGEWGPELFGGRRLRSDQWAPLEATVYAADIEAVEQALEELTGFMDYFREDVDGSPMTGVTDGQLAVVHSTGTDSFGRRLLQVTFYAAGPVGESSPDAFERLRRAASALVDELNAQGIEVQEIRWAEQPYIIRPF